MIPEATLAKGCLAHDLDRQDTAKCQKFPIAIENLSVSAIERFHLRLTQLHPHY